MIVRLVLMMGLVFCLTTGASEAQAAKNTKYASIVIDARTGKVLRERYADKKLHPASLTKMMTLYMTFDALKSGRLRKNQSLHVSARAAGMQPSKLGLKPGETIKVEHAILALVTKSANDVAVVLGEAIGGSEINFAKMMTQRARSLGMWNTVFKNASGLHNRYQISTARDMARLSQALLLDHPEYYHYFATEKFTYRGKTYRSHNRLMTSYEGMDGIKTGYIRASGFNLAASVMRDGRRLIGVVFGGRSSKTRNRHMATILNEGFSTARKIRLARFDAQTPHPVRKPEMGYQVAALDPTRNSYSNDLPEFETMGLIIGEGDAEAEASADVVASLTNMAKTTAGLRPVQKWRDKAHKAQKVTMAQLAAAQPGGGWAVQVGAFADKRAGYQVLQKAVNKLPQDLVAVSERHLVPLATQRGVVYRARLVGLDQQGAERACEMLKNCIILAAN